MKDWQKKVIKKNRKKLNDLDTFTPEFLKDLEDKKLITKHERTEVVRKQRFESYGGYVMNLYMYEDILYKRDSYDGFIEVLVEHDFSEAANILLEGRRIERRRVLDDDDDVLDFVRNDEPLEIIVEKPLSGYVHWPDDSYKLSEPKKKLALVINIRKFKVQDERVGAEHDTNYMVKLLKGLNFEVWNTNTEKEEYKKAELVQAVDDFSDFCSKQKPNSIDAIMIFIESHGYRDYIRTSDEEDVHIYEDIVYKFRHHNLDGCPELKGRPKIFIFPTCQTFKTEINAETSLNEASKESSPSSDVGDEIKPGKRERSTTPPLSSKKLKISLPIVQDSTIHDAIVVVPQIPGQEANLDGLRGSWFVLVFAYVVMKLAAEWSFVDMMDKVAQLMTKINSTNYEPQVPAYTPYKFGKMYLFSKMIKPDAD